MARILSGEAAAASRQQSAVINARAAGQVPAGDSDEAGELDLQTIHPDVPFPLAGRLLTMREYGHIEGLRLQCWARPFVDALYAVVAQDAGTPPTLSQIRQLMAEHADLVCTMVAQALTTPGDNPAGILQEREALMQWIERLSDRDGQLLLAIWWQVNVHFFFRLVFERALEAAAAARDRPSAGHASITA